MPPLWTLLTLAPLAWADAPAQAPPLPRPFVVRVVDKQTGRGVPLVELRTVNEVRYVTDSAGLAAVAEPGLSGRSVFFHVKAHGYEFPKDGFGYRGKALELTEGGSATLELDRLNVAERLYRVTGAGIYRDTALAGRTPPTRRPLLNAEVLGSDSVLNAVFRGKLYWFWGDTNRPGYPLGNFHVPGAVSDLPGRGGLDPEAGVDLNYFTAPNGFAAETARLPGPGPTWLGGLVVLNEGGRERMVAGYAKIRNMLETYEHGLVEFDPGTQTFQKVATFPLDSPLRPGGHTGEGREGGVDYVYFQTPFPLTRVRADLAHLKDVATYEAYTCLETGTRLDPKGPAKPSPKIDRGPDGRARYAWRANTSPVGPGEQLKLVQAGVLRADEALLGLRDAETGKAVLAHGGTVTWNAHRKRFVLVAVEMFGSASLLGEVWYAEADTPLGPWAYARKVVTHDKYSFYNPKQHPYFDRDGGRRIFFEGTYTASFSGNTDPTPRYEYNQVMYALDLDDPRLNLPAAVYPKEGGGYASGASHAGRSAPAFFALTRPGAGTVPVYVGKDGGPRVGSGAADAPGATPAFYAIRADMKDPPEGTAPLFAFRAPGSEGQVLTLESEAPIDRIRSDRPLCRVWPSPTRVVLPPSPEFGGR